MSKQPDILFYFYKEYKLKQEILKREKEIRKHEFEKILNDKPLKRQRRGCVD